jgi:hypothetical protein
MLPFLSDNRVRKSAVQNTLSVSTWILLPESSPHTG